MLDWMAWTWQTATFFGGIGAMLAALIALEQIRPTRPRRGIFGLTTTRGDRVFMSLLASAFIHLGWLGLSDSPLLWASGISIAAAAAIFRWA